MFNLDKFIADSVIFRPVGLFEADFQANRRISERKAKLAWALLSEKEEGEVKSQIHISVTFTLLSPTCHLVLLAVNP